VAPLVAIRGLTVRYPETGRPALSALSFDVGAGEVVGLVGATGSGRSTLLRALLGIVPRLVPASVEGTLSVAGLDPSVTPVAGMAAVASLVLDDAEAQLSQLTVADEVAFGLEGLGTPPAEMRVRVPEILARVGLGGFEERNPLALSGGEQQRVALACALVTRPRLLLLDDPTSSLDPRTARLVLELTTTLAAETGAAVLLATNDGDLLAEHARRLLVLDRGRLVADGPPSAGWAAAIGAAPGAAVPSIASLASRVRPGDGDLPGTVTEAVAWLEDRA
jgi:energy-coupling factor transport system ATP-binding protein